MSTPRKNDFSSPYASAPVHQAAYRSQSEDYLSMLVGGQTQTPNADNRRRQQQQHGNNFTPNFYRNNQSDGGNVPNFYKNNQNSANESGHVPNFYRTNYNSGSGDGGAVPYFYQDRTPNNRYNNRQNYQQNRQQRRGNWNGGGVGGAGRRSYQRNNQQRGTASINDYIHPSMLEDPWAELMKRHEALSSCDLKLHLTREQVMAEEAQTRQKAYDEEAEKDNKTKI